MSKKGDFWVHACFEFFLTEQSVTWSKSIISKKGKFPNLGVKGKERKIKNALYEKLESKSIKFQCLNVETFGGPLFYALIT